MFKRLIHAGNLQILFDVMFAQVDLITNGNRFPDGTKERDSIEGSPFYSRNNKEEAWPRVPVQRHPRLKLRPYGATSVIQSLGYDIIKFAFCIGASMLQNYPALPQSDAPLPPLVRTNSFAR